MLMLEESGMDRARAFVSARARPLDRALWAFHLDGGSADAVLRELAAYRNDDGGFGRALEPDLRAPESSVLATQTALHVLRRLGDPGHPLVGDAVAYLVATYDVDRRVWRFIPKSAGEHPHAPWWDQAGLADTFDGFLVNPRANIVGHLMWASAEEARPIVDALLDELLSAFHAEDGPVDLNSLACWRSLVAGLEGPDRPDAEKHLVDLVARSVERDEAKWDTYCLRPLDAVSGPDDPAVAALGDLVDRHLDHEILRQASDGSWRPTWSWFGSFPDVWPTAEQEWAGELTVTAVRTLERFGRIAR